MLRNYIARAARGCGAALALAATLTAVAPVPGAGAVGTLAAPTASPTSSPPASLPPDLVALEQKLSEQTITSLRFSAAVSTVEAHPSHKPTPFSKLFSDLLPSALSGEVTIAPAAANIELTLTGQPLTFRLVGGRVYFYVKQAASFDGGRPWIALGPQGLLELATDEGSHGHVAPLRAHGMESSKQSLGAPALVQPPFTSLAKMLAAARKVSELGPGVADGQPVTRFIADLYPSQTEPPRTPSELKLRRRLQRAYRRLRIHVVSPTTTLEVALAATGVPVRIVIAVHDGSTTTLSTLDIPAVNFPLAIEAPPASQTITAKEFKALERRRHKRALARRHHA